MKRILILPAFLLLLIGCGPVVTFNQPQPEGVDSLRVIPKKLIGRYISKDGSGKLIIDRKSMIIRYDYEVKVPKDSVDWEDLSAEDRKHYKVEGNSVIEHITNTDTLFYFSEDNVLKKFKGYYFLNSRIDKESWFVQKLKLQKGVLTLGTISSEEELKTLETINESPIDTITYNIKFTRKQFKSYLENNGFSDVDSFIRVK